MTSWFFDAWSYKNVIFIFLPGSNEYIHVCISAGNFTRLHLQLIFNTERSAIIFTKKHTSVASTTQKQLFTMQQSNPKSNQLTWSRDWFMSWWSGMSIFPCAIDSKKPTRPDPDPTRVDPTRSDPTRWRTMVTITRCVTQIVHLEHDLHWIQDT